MSGQSQGNAAEVCTLVGLSAHGYSFMIPVSYQHSGCSEWTNEEACMSGDRRQRSGWAPLDDDDDDDDEDDDEDKDGDDDDDDDNNDDEDTPHSTQESTPGPEEETASRPSGPG
eukprot:9495303-Pyramimonas_sp.AAC.1